MRTSFCIYTATAIALIAFSKAEKASSQPLHPPSAQIHEPVLQGVWNAQTIEKDGKMAPDEAAKRMRFTFQGDRLLVTGNTASDKEVGGPYKVDSTKSPKQLEFTPPEETKPILGIYELTEDQLKVCMRHASSDKGRPTEFKTTADSDLILVVFKRQKR